MRKELFQDREFARNPQQTKEEQGRRQLMKGLKLAIVLILVFFYPFTFLGVIPFAFLIRVHKKDIANHVDDVNYEPLFNRKRTLFWLASLLMFLVNIVFFLVIPRGYFSSYLLFPFNLFRHALRFNYQTILALIVGGFGMSSNFMSIYLVFDRMRVDTKERKREKVKNSKAYKNRQKNRFKESQNFTKNYEETYEDMLAIDDYIEQKKLKAALKSKVLIGTDEYGKPFYLTLKELNQHAFMEATTGSGKTTFLQILMEHCIKFDIPFVFFDGKGDTKNLATIEKLAGLFNKNVVAFTDQHDIAYNPIKYGNSTEIKDRLVSLAETESTYYTNAAKSLLMSTTQLLDAFHIQRTFKNLSKYFLPKNVLDLFVRELEEKGIEVFVRYEKVETKKKKNNSEEKKKSTVKGLELAEENDDEEEFPTEEAWEKVEYDPDTLSIEMYYSFIRNKVNVLNDRSQELFEQLFIRYEFKDSPFYLYATSESLQTNINMLLDSEVGGLFDTEHSESELDFARVFKEKQFVYISLDGLIYDEFIEQMAHFVVGDLKHLASEIYKRSNKSEPIFAFFDEPSSYLDQSFVDVVNKGRGAGLHAMYSPQTLSDIKRIDPELLNQVVGNVNTFIVGHINTNDDIDFWANLFGTYKDTELTEMVEQADGFNNLDAVSWTGERGTKREVDKFNVHPNDIKKLRTGEFYIYRKGANITEPIRKVYVRNPLKT